jgi:hypothetical protein
VFYNFINNSTNNRGKNDERPRIVFK